MITSTPDRKTPFKDGRPGETWWRAFMDKHKELAVRIPERVSKARAGVSEASIRLWFEDLKNNIETQNLSEMMADPNRIYNCDETNIQLAPNTGKVIGIKGQRNTYEVSPAPEKSNLTFVGTFSAAGDIVEPTLIFPYKRIPKDIIDSMPDTIKAARTESGWMTSEAFFNFIVEVFNKYLEEKNITKPVILFIDGHSSHLTMQLSVKCEELGIVIYILPPNTTHILQPADVGPFKPFKTFWRQAVHNFQCKNPNQVVKRRDVGPLIDEVLPMINKDCIINGFRICGLFPLNPNAVDYAKCLDVQYVDEDPQPSTSSDNSCSSEEYSVALKVIRHELGSVKSNFCHNKVNLHVNDLYELYANVIHKSMLHNSDPNILEENETTEAPIVELNPEIEVEPNETLYEISNSNEVQQSVESQVPRTITQSLNTATPEAVKSVINLQALTTQSFTATPGMCNLSQTVELDQSSDIPMYIVQESPQVSEKSVVDVSLHTASRHLNLFSSYSSPSTPSFFPIISEHSINLLSEKPKNTLKRNVVVSNSSSFIPNSLINAPEYTSTISNTHDVIPTTSSVVSETHKAVVESNSTMDDTPIALERPSFAVESPLQESVSSIIAAETSTIPLEPPTVPLDHPNYMLETTIVASEHLKSSEISPSIESDLSPVLKESSSIASEIPNITPVTRSCLSEPQPLVIECYSTVQEASVHKLHHPVVITEEHALKSSSPLLTLKSSVFLEQQQTAPERSVCISEPSSIADPILSKSESTLPLENPPPVVKPLSVQIEPSSSASEFHPFKLEHASLRSEKHSFESAYPENESETPQHLPELKSFTSESIANTSEPRPIEPETFQSSSKTLQSASDILMCTSQTPTASETLLVTSESSHQSIVSLSAPNEDSSAQPKGNDNQSFIQQREKRIGYHSRVPKEHIFNETKIEYKKRKSSENSKPSMLVTKEFRKYCVEHKSKKKKSNNEWDCIYCKFSWTDDVKLNRYSKWIECDQCPLKMHTSCVPKKHKEMISYDSEDSSEEVVFSCEFCSK